MRKLLASLVTLTTVGVAVLLGAGPAQAAGYLYRPGDVMHLDGPGSLPNFCTGGYAVRGSSGMFLVSAGHCWGYGRIGNVVFGTDRRFGTVIRNDRIGDVYDTNSFDGALIRMDAGDDATQIVVDPVTGRSPGKVVGYFNNSALSAGMVIGKMGRKTGWTEGRITEWRLLRYKDGVRDYLLCSTADSDGGDSGGPVWQSDGAGHVWAVGITIARSNGMMCFNPIQNVLSRFGATLPVHPYTRGAGQQPSRVTERSGPPIPVNPDPVPGELL
ncbi:trypsin-like serine protease [Micromonospora sp. NPDC049044]|uniref:trypsin-like serine protease n=1 Tax=unclassified Micromonospora TaxID=2617518 RepID=UPI0033E95956